MSRPAEPSNPASQAEPDGLPIFPATAPPIFADGPATKALFGAVLGELARVVDVPASSLTATTPCDDFDVQGLRRHALAWLQFFAQSLGSPDGAASRIDPETWTLADDQRASDIVRSALADIERAVDAGVADKLVVMAQARMQGDAVLAMALGEYLVHGWDLAVATGTSWTAPGQAAAPALAFLHGTVAPEYRGPNSGFYGDEVSAPDNASDFEQLLCFAGRHPQWSK